MSASGNSGQRPPQDAEGSLRQEGHECESAPGQKSQCGSVAFSPLKRMHNQKGGRSYNHRTERIDLNPDRRWKNVKTNQIFLVSGW